MAAKSSTDALRMPALSPVHEVAMQASARMVATGVWLRRIVLPLAIAIAAVPVAGVAQNVAKPAIRQSVPLSIEADKAQLVQLPEPAKTVFVANPEIADVQVPTPSTVLIYGKKAGTTTVFAITETGTITSYAVKV